MRQTERYNPVHDWIDIQADTDLIKWHRLQLLCQCQYKIQPSAIYSVMAGC